MMPSEIMPSQSRRMMLKRLLQERSCSGTKHLQPGRKQTRCPIWCVMTTRNYGHSKPTFCETEMTLAALYDGVACLALMVWKCRLSWLLRHPKARSSSFPCHTYLGSSSLQSGAQCG